MVDNPLAKARGLSLRAGGQTCFIFYWIVGKFILRSYCKKLSIEVNKTENKIIWEYIIGLSN